MPRAPPCLFARTKLWSAAPCCRFPPRKLVCGLAFCLPPTAFCLLFFHPSGRPARPVPVESFPEGALNKSLEHVEGNLYAGKPQVAQIIGSPNVFDIKVVVVAPAYWPSLIVPERIAAILEAVIPAAHLGARHVERVAVTEMGSVIDVRNAAILAAAAVVSNGLCLLPCGLLRLLGALWLSLRLLGALRLCLLFALWLSLRLLGTLRLCLLCALWLSLCRLCVLWLRLVLRRLGFSSASALFLFAFLCECRNGSTEEH